ncbi:MAG TPA: GGDEF domain-containing protein [Bordetella sp.]
MFVDQTSLLLALGIASFALSCTLLVTWLFTRTDPFILTWALGTFVLVFAFACFSIYAVNFNALLGLVSNFLLTSSFVILYGASCLFTEQRLPIRRVAIIETSCLLLLGLPVAFGFTALGALAGNLLNAGLLLLTARKFWVGRHETPVWIVGIVIFYTLAALSFLPCAAMIYLKGPLVLRAPPSGWAEDLNSIVGLIGITGIGALSLALNQARSASRHREEARTDPLTGLLNRRALFDLYGVGTLAKNTAVLVFDLDHFKSINDVHGHGMGDEVLRRFARVMRASLRARDTAARLGGEEFALILPASTPEIIMRLAERIRIGFAAETFQTPSGPLRCTVSAGVAFAVEESEHFDAVLSRADKALYLAKDSGRNHVMAPDLKRVA